MQVDEAADEQTYAVSASHRQANGAKCITSRAAHARQPVSLI